MCVECMLASTGKGHYGSPFPASSDTVSTYSTTVSRPIKGRKATAANKCLYIAKQSSQPSADS